MPCAFNLWPHSFFLSPHGFAMRLSPLTQWLRHALVWPPSCPQAAGDAGLQKARIGNVHLVTQTLCKSGIGSEVLSICLTYIVNLKYPKV